ncbi:ABC transporter substrate-binding protein [Roseateles sp.]|uniref:ABC transporter substrate-binding protein n=1 Tax=Roseateles sp. TaxID=1971397 RepID=UPI003BA6F9FC
MVKTKRINRQAWPWCKLLLAVAVSVSTTRLPAAEYFDSYGLSSASAALDLGSQPLGYPSGVISAVMARDRILARALQDLKRPLKVHPFKRGADMLPLLADGRLEAGLLGDMPTLLAASEGKIWIAGLVKKTSTAIVARTSLTLQDLLGKRIAYVEASSAHLTLLQGLAAAGLAPKQFTLVPMTVGEMPAALQRGEIDAFAAWEPAPTIALSQSPQNRIVFRSHSTDYLVLRRDLPQQSPQAAQQLLAAYLRGIEWLRRSQFNQERAARWALADTQSFASATKTGGGSGIAVAQIVAITRREILDVPSAPMIVVDPAAPTLQREFEFLSQLGRLPAGASWQQVQTALTYPGLAQVQAQARELGLRRFDYSDTPSRED